MRDLINEFVVNLREKRQRDRELLEKTEQLFLDSLRESYKRSDERGELRSTRLVADIVEAFEKNGYAITRTGKAITNTEDSTQIPAFLMNVRRR